MVFLFRDKSIINVLFLVLLALVAHVHFFFQDLVLTDASSDGFFSWLISHYLMNLNKIFLFFLYLIILLTQAVRLNLFMMELRMFQQSGYTVAMTYILLSGLLTQWTSITPALLANFLMIWIFIKMTRLFNQPDPKNLLFNTGLIIGLSTFCYHPTAMMILVVLFALTIIRPFKLKEWMVLILGVVLPYYFLTAWLFWNDSLYKIGAYIPKIGFTIPPVVYKQTFQISVSALGFVFLIGFVYWQQFNRRLIIQIRKYWSALLVMGMILVIAPFVFKEAGIEAGIMCLVPLSAFVSNVFSYPKRLFLPNLLFLLMLAVVIYNKWPTLIKF